MLLELQIKDFAIIEHLCLGFQSGLSILTGETGAGKSIIIDALGTLRGEKVTASLVRAGNIRARVEGVFSLVDHPEVIPLLHEYGLWDDDGEPLIITREISADSGRSVSRINGRVVNQSILREIGGRLIDIHGQHEGLSIFNTRTHMDMLDRYGGLFTLREDIATCYNNLRQLREELAELHQNKATRQERIEELQMLLEDVEAANLQPDEEKTLKQERSVLQNAARIAEIVEGIYILLSKGDESGSYPQRSIIELFGNVNNELNDLARLDPSTANIVEHSEDMLYRLEDLANIIRDYVDRFDFEPGRLDEIEDRLTLIRSLQRKYHGTIAEILERASHAEGEIERLSHSDERIVELEQTEQALLEELGTKAGKLSQKRNIVGQNLSQSIETSLKDLALPYVQFAVQIDQVEDQQGVPVPIALVKSVEDREKNTEKTKKQVEKDTCIYCQITPTGIDRIEFLISPNPGEPLKSLVRIASGGESARVLLALKSILSRVDMTPTLVFDEVDVGVGGRAGQVVGQKLWGMTEKHQVLCITHLPQVAAFADTHYAISKTIDKSQQGDLRTRAGVRVLSFEERVDEIAAMLDGIPVSESSRANAREIIERANAIKSGEKESCNVKQK